MHRIKLFDIFEMFYELPIAVMYGFYTTEEKLIGTKSYYKSWYKKLRRNNVKDN